MQLLKDLKVLVGKTINKQSLEPGPKTKELRPIGVYSELLHARLLGQRGLIAYLGDDLFFPVKEFTSFFLSYLNLVIPLRFK